MVTPLRVRRDRPCRDNRVQQSGSGVSAFSGVFVPCEGGMLSTQAVGGREKKRPMYETSTLAKMAT